MTLTIPIDTPPQGRPRFTRTGIAYDKPESRKFKQDCASLILPQIRGHEKFIGAVRVTMKIYRPAAKFPKRGIISQKYGDIDNLVKAVFDAVTLTDAVWVDDRQVAEMHVWKLLDAEPRIELEILEIKGCEDNG